MAQLRGPFTINGRIGNCIFYTVRGKTFIRMAASRSKNQLKKSPRFTYLRRNMNRFTGLVKATKSFTIALQAARRFFDSTFHRRATSLIAQIGRVCKKEGSPSYLLSKHKHLFVGLELNRKLPLATFFHHPGQGNSSAPPGWTRDCLMLNLRGLKNLADATHFRLVRILAIVPDKVLDEQNQEFVPAAPEQEGIYAESQTPIVPIGEPNQEHVLRTLLPVENVAPAATVVELMGIEFFRQVDDRYEPISNAKAMRIVDAF